MNRKNLAILPTDTGKVNSLFQSGQSIYKSGSTIIDATNGNNADSPSK